MYNKIKSMNWKDIKKLIKEELTKEDKQITVGNTKFNLRMGVNRNKTKLGIKIQFEELSEPLSTEVRDKLATALQEKLNEGLSKYKMIVNVDTDVPHRDRMDGSRIKPIAFFIPLAQIKSLVIEGLGQGDAEVPDAPEAPAPTGEEPTPEDKEIEEMIRAEMLNEMKVGTLNEISKVVRKEDFYEFINKGNNILRTLEESDYTIPEAKKYLKYLVQHNIM